MIKGVANWNDRSRFWVQTKNATEALLKVALPAGADGIHHGWLETCGPTSAVNVLDAMGKPLKCSSPGGASIRPMDFLTVWMNTPANLPAMSKTITNPDLYMENEIAEFYPEAVAEVFGCQVDFYVNETFEWIAPLVSGGHGAMICLKSPGHFLAVVAYDDEKQELIYNDSWPGRTGTDGFNLRLTKEDFKSNVKPYVLIFS